ncbi:MAG: GC-type dockerin domain-anchored protein [Phycisphaerales bacterium]
MNRAHTTTQPGSRIPTAQRLRGLAGHVAGASLALAGLAAFSPDHCHARPNLLTNGSFELPGLPVGTNSFFGPGTALTGWTISCLGTPVSGQGIDYDRTFQPSDLFHTVSTNWAVGSSSQVCGISQTVATVNGEAYTISFDATRERPELVAGQASTRGVQVWWRNNLVGTVVLPPNAAQTNTNMMWRRYSFTVSGSGGNDTLEFRDVFSGVTGFGVELDNVSLDRFTCPVAGSTPFVQLPRDVRCGDAPAATAHYSIDALGLVNNPGGYITVGQRQLPSGFLGLHVVRWNTNSTIAAERLFSTDLAGDSIIGTSVEVNAQCDALVAGRIYNGGTRQSFAIRLDPNLMPIGAGIRLNGPVDSNVDVQADWLMDGTVAIVDRLNPSASILSTRITRRTAALGPMWSKRYQSFQVSPNPQFVARDIEQDPVTGDLYVAGTMNWNPSGTAIRTLPMIMNVLLGNGNIIQVRGYDYAVSTPWTTGGFNAIKFNPSLGAKQNQIVVAGWATRPNPTPFEPAITVPRLTMIDRGTLTTAPHYDRLYTSLIDWVPGVSAISIPLQGSPPPPNNNIMLAGRTNGMPGFGWTLRANEPNGAISFAHRHGSPVPGSSNYALSDITPGGHRAMIGAYSIINVGGGSQMWLSKDACPTVVPTPDPLIQTIAMGTGEVVPSDEQTDFPTLSLVEFIVASPCSTICRFCFVNCDQSTASPMLNINDFQCFLNAFAIGDPYANCDESTSPPVLNVNDFSCFLNAFAAGCT